LDGLGEARLYLAARDQNEHRVRRHVRDGALERLEVACLPGLHGVGEQVSRARVEGECGELGGQRLHARLPGVEALERAGAALLLGALPQAGSPGVDLGVVLAGDQVDGVEAAHGWESRSGWRW